MRKALPTLGGNTVTRAGKQLTSGSWFTAKNSGYVRDFIATNPKKHSNESLPRGYGVLKISNRK